LHDHYFSPYSQKNTSRSGLVFMYLWDAVLDPGISSFAGSAGLRMLSSGNSRHLFIRATVHQPRSLSGPEDINAVINGDCSDAEAWPVSADQFILFNDKIQGIDQRDTRIDMLLNHLFITERRIAKREAIVLFQQAGQQGLPDINRRRRDDAARMKGDLFA
jgi:hypothetical protein